MRHNYPNQNDFCEGDLSPEEAVFTALAGAEDRVSRLDERVGASGFEQGWRERADVRAVVAAMGIAGRHIHPEDLILNDLGTDTRIPEADVFRARQVLLARRKAYRGGAELLGWNGVAWLCGLTRQPPPFGPRPSARLDQKGRRFAGPYAQLDAFFETLHRGEADTARAGVEECMAVLDIGPLPPLLSAGALLEAWRVVDPLPQHQFAGALVAAVFLRTCKRFPVGLYPLEVAQKRRPMSPRLAWGPLADRLVYWLGLMETAADLELEELVRLGHQKALIERKACGGRRNSKAPELAQLAVNSAVLTTESIVQALGITPQASLKLVRQMEGLLHEITGRTRYRVWRL